MTTFIEWGNAKFVTPRLYIAQPGEINNGDAENEQTALVMDDGSGLFVLEGTADELIQFASRVLQLSIILKDEENA